MLGRSFVGPETPGASYPPYRSGQGVLGLDDRSACLDLRILDDLGERANRLAGHRRFPQTFRPVRRWLFEEPGGDFPENLTSPLATPRVGR